MTYKKPLFIELATPNDYIPTSTYYINPNGIYAPEHGNPTSNPIEGCKIYNEYVHALINKEIKNYSFEELITIALEDNTQQSVIIAKHLIEVGKNKNNDSKYLTAFFNIKEDPNLPTQIKKALSGNEVREMMSSDMILKLQNRLKEFRLEKS